MDMGLKLSLVFLIILSGPQLGDNFRKDFSNERGS